MKGRARAAFVVLLFASQASGQTVEFTSSNLPIVVIETGGIEIPDDPKIPATMGIIRGDGVRNTLTDPFTDFHGPVGIELRGTSSLAYDQKQYAVETRDSLGDERDVALMGFPEESDWILYAPFVDKSLMRNVLMYNAARETGRYASRTRFCELVLDGKYQGVYVLMEKIKRDRNRVNVSKLDPETDHGEELSGGYIIAIDHGGKEGDLGFAGAFDSLGYFTYWHVYPTSKNINLHQRWYIEDYITKFEDVMRHPAFDETRRGYTAYIDVGSFVDYLLLNEWANNVDGFIASLYLHKDRASVNHRIVAGPVWDFNIAFGNANYSGGERTSGWRSHYGRVPFWWRRMLQDTTFTTRIGQRWRELRGTALSDTRVVQVIDSLAALAAEAQQRHFTRWKLLGVNIWPNAFVGQSFEEEITYLKSWSLDRMAWMDGNIHTIGLPREDAVLGAAPDKKMPESFVMTAHPLPANDRVSVTLQLPRALTGVLSLRDVLGRELRRETVSSSDAGVLRASFHLRELPDGLYHLVLHVGSDIAATAKIVIAR